MAVKRRTVWLSDDEWATLTQAAKANGHNVSEEIRSIWHYADQAAISPTRATLEFRPVPKPSTKARR